MADVIVTSSLDVPYSFKDKNGKDVMGSTYYSMLYDGHGIPRVVKTNKYIDTAICYSDALELRYDYKGRLIV